jgi:hypothetical protein
VQQLTQYSVPKGNNDQRDFAIGNNRIVLDSGGAGDSAVFYRRFDNATGLLLSECLVASDRETVVIAVFPIPALFAPKQLADKIYLKFKSPVIVDQKGDVVFYTTIPVEIAVYRQSEDEELLLDVFSLQKQKYALYGSPEKGVLCRYKEVEIHTDRDNVKPLRFQEALVRVAIRNGIDNVVKISKLIIPMDGVILDHSNDDCWLTGSIEMNLDQAFGKDVINVQLIGSKVKRLDKTSIACRTDSLNFLMDSGY